MKTSTLLMIAGGAAALYYLSKKKAEEAGQATQGVQSPPLVAPNAVAQMAAAPQVIVVAPDAPDDDGTINYGPWGWATPVFGGRAWRPGGGGGGHGGHGSGHGHGGHH